MSRGRQQSNTPQRREKEEREGRAHNQTTPIQKPQKEEKRREKTTQAVFRSTKNPPKNITFHHIKTLNVANNPCMEY